MPRSRGRPLLACLLALVTALAAAGCGARTGDPRPGGAAQVDVSAGTVKVGLLNSLSGTMAISEVTVRDALMLAIEEINAAGGILGRQIDLLTRDTAGDPTKAVNFAQQLAFSDKVDFVIGPVNSGEGLATTPVLAKAGIPTMVIGSIDQLTVISTDGASALTRTVGQVLGEGQEVIKSLTGLDLNTLVANIASKTVVDGTPPRS